MSRTLRVFLMGIGGLSAVFGLLGILGVWETGVTSSLWVAIPQLVLGVGLLIRASRNAI